MFDTTPLSSSIDWCEENYVQNEYIAEYVNSMSSLIMCYIGIYGMIHYEKVAFLFIMLVIIGFASFVFHATLSEFGQMFDEISIVATIIVALNHMNKHVHTIINVRIMHILSVIMMLSVICMIKYNRFIMFAWSVPIVLFVRKYYSDLDVISSKYIYYAQGLFVIGFVCWIIDYACFSALYYLYLHGVWHCLVGYCAFFVFKSISRLQILTLD